MKKLLFYRNSDFKINRYFTKAQFKARIIEASTHGKEIFYNEIRKLNNCRFALKEQGDIFIKDIFIHYWNDFKLKYINQLSRSGVIDSIESMISCHNFDNGFTFYQCPSCDDFYMMGFSCHSRFCSSCGPKLNKEETTIKNTQTLTNYIARYASHPPISKRRIVNVDYSTNQVTWFYDPHEDDDIFEDDKKLGRQYITEDVFEFMKKLIAHIPTKGFQQIRYYGFYSNKFKDKITSIPLFTNAQLTKMLDNTYWVNGLKSSFGYNPLLCKCGSYMILNLELSYFP